MKIGVDLCDLDPDYVGGVNTFAFGLVHGLIATRASDDQLILLVTGRNEAFLRKIFEDRDVTFLMLPSSRFGVRLDIWIFRVSWITGNFKLRYWFDRIFRVRVMRRIDRAIDALIAPMTLLRFYGMRAPSLLSIHDIQQEYHPEFFSWRDRVRRWGPYRLSAWRAGGIQASSRYIKDCLIEKFPFVDPEKIFIIPEGVDREKFSPEARQEKPPAVAHLKGDDFVFYPAQLWPHKNHLLLMDSLARYRDDRGAEVPCVLSGRDYGHWSAVAEYVAALGLKQVHYLGRVNFEQLLWLYRNCRAVLALGLHESSSLPVREGAVFGKVLICLDIPPNREVKKHLRVELVDCIDASDLAAAFVALMQDRGGMIETARENALLVDRFDWKTVASEYYRVLKQLAPGIRRRCPF